MPMYSYKGINSAGNQVSGIKDVDSPKSLRQAMRREGVTVLDYSVSKGGKKESKGQGLGKEIHLAQALGMTGIKQVDLAGFSRQLGTMLSAGTPLAEAMMIQFEQTEKPQLKSIIGEVRTAVNEGSSLANALARHDKVFDHLFISMVRSGEQAGNLEEVLLSIAEFNEQSAKLRSKVTAAMVYPSIMMAVGSLVIVYLLVKGIPKIAKIFSTRDIDLPPLTRFLIWMSNTFRDYWWLGILVIGISIAGFISWKRTPDGKKTWHQFVLKSKGVGPLARKIATARFARTLGTMLRSGVSILEAMITAKNVMGNVIMMEAVDTARDDVQEGESLANSLKKTGEFPNGLIHMIRVGERSGDLEGMLLHVANDLERDIEARLERLTALVGPLMLLVMAGFVVLVVISVLGPMQDIQKAMRR